MKENVEGSLMPPEGKPQPSRQEIEAVAQWIDAALNQADCGGDVDPGRVTIRRLNRAEYNNTIRDLVGIDFRPADDFPSDDVGYGFDNIGDVLTIPPILMEKYLAAAEAIAEHAIVAGSSRDRSRNGRPQRAMTGRRYSDDDARFSRPGRDLVTYTAARNGNYIVRVRRSASRPARAGPMALRSTASRGRIRRDCRRGASGHLRGRDPLGKGSHRIAAAFLNDYFKPDDPDPSRRDRNLAVQSVEVEGPLHVPGDPLPESHRRLIFRTPTKPEEFQDCARKSCEVPHRAYRRPSPAARWPSCCGLSIWPRERRFFRAGHPARGSGRAGLAPVPLSGRAQPRPRQAGRARQPTASLGVPLNDFEVASRLSYFLWSSMPDDELFKLALDGKLQNGRRTCEPGPPDAPATPRPSALVENFAGQWLQLRNLKTASPDKDQFPAFDEPLRAGHAAGDPSCSSPR